MYHVLPMDPEQPLFLGSGSLCAHESKAQTGYPLPWQWESPGVYGGDYVVPPHGGHAVQPPPPPPHGGGHTVKPPSGKH
jgi:hypothetical protein